MIICLKVTLSSSKNSATTDETHKQNFKYPIKLKTSKTLQF